MLIISDIHKSYGKHKVLKGVNLSVAKGEVICLLGRNGEGKTTLLDIVGNMNSSDVGDININGISLNKNVKKYKKLLGYVQNSENVNFFNHLTGYEVIELYLTMYDIDCLDNKLKMFIEHLDLDNELNKKVSDLSTGNKRKLMILTALIHSPEILIMDEPTLGLDIEAKETLNKIIKELSFDKAILICTHELDVVEGLANKVAILGYGKIVDCDSKENLIKKYRKKSLVEVYKELRTNAVK